MASAVLRYNDGSVRAQAAPLLTRGRCDRIGRGYIFEARMDAVAPAALPSESLAPHKRPLMKASVPAPISGGLILSYACSAECLHCMYGCSPRWSRDWISEEDLARILGQLAPHIAPGPYGPQSIGLSQGLHFTGGEPFMNFELLCKAVELASALRIPSLFVETNCFWCKEDQSTREKLRLLRDRGLHGMLISVNPFYLEFVPFERTERGLRIGFELFGRNLAVYQLEYYRRFKALGLRGTVSFDDYVEMESREELLRGVEFFFMGRAVYGLAEKMGEVFRRYPPSELCRERCMPPFVRSWHNHFDNYGNYVPGFCGGLSFGDCRQLGTLLREGVDLEERPILALLMKDDFEGLLRFAGEHGYEECREGYLSKCHLCTDLRKHLVGKHEFKELQPREFYSHLAGGIR